MRVQVTVQKDLLPPPPELNLLEIPRVGDQLYIDYQTGHAPWPIMEVVAVRHEVSIGNGSSEYPGDHIVFVFVKEAEGDNS